MERWVHKFEIKPDRWIVVPSEPERLYGERLLGKLWRLWQPPPYFFHLRSGGHLAAIKSHLDHAYFCCLDIEDFFGSINRSRLIRTLKLVMSYSDAVDAASRSLVRLWRGGEPYQCLPFGFIQSAYLASMCLHKSKLGSTLAAANERDALRVSVYMDDIVVSANDLSLLESSMNEILSASNRSRFPISETKIQHPSESVTVFNIELTQGQMRITQDRMEKFRIAYSASENSAQAEGIIGYVRAVNPAQIAQIFS